MNAIRSVGITANRSVPDVESILRRAVDLLRGAGREILMDHALSGWLDEGEGAGELSEFASRCQLVLVFGGDGTFLRTARSLEEQSVPMLGVNVGSLGFLTVLKRAAFEPALVQILEGRYRHEQRMRLKASLVRGGEILSEHLALNDAVVHMGHASRLVEFSISVGGEYLGGYRADGLIVATPTGSTAYSMSAGGPIVHPTIDALVATPICPHALSIRPLVLGGEDQVGVRIGGRSGEAALILDGMIKVWLQVNDEIRITKADRDQPILLPADFSYYDLVRQKLGWGRVPQED